MKVMESLHDLIEEAKLRTVWWILCIFAVTYFLTRKLQLFVFRLFVIINEYMTINCDSMFFSIVDTSKSMLVNVPISVLLIAGLRILLNEVEFRWKVRKPRSTSYLSYLENKQLSVNDYRLTTTPPPQKWKMKIDSPVVEAAMEDFINKILRDFVVDLWYSDITPDKEAPAFNSCDCYGCSW